MRATVAGDATHTERDTGMTLLRRPIRAPGMSAKLRVAAVAVLAFSAVACGEGTPDGGAVTSPTVTSTTRMPTTSTTIESLVTSDTASPTTTPSSTATPITTTTVVDASEHVSPKPVGEPEITLLPISPFSFTAALERGSESFVELEVPAKVFSFEEVSGYSSYAVAIEYVWRSAGESTTVLQEGRVDGSFVYFALKGSSNGHQEFLYSEKELQEEMESWVRQEGEWTPVEGSGSAIFLFEIIRMEAAHKLLYDTFDTLTFEDWDLIDGVWYARYAASREFVVANFFPRGEPERLTDSAGDVWVSPQGFLHSFEVSATVADQDGFLESTWRLSGLGSTKVSLLDPPADPMILAELEESSKVELVMELLSTKSWDPVVLFGAEPFRWRGRWLNDRIDADASDGYDYADVRTDRESWGVVGSDGVASQRTVNVSVDNGDAFETVIIDEAWWERLGTVDEDGLFVSDGSDWFAIEVVPIPESATSGLLATGYWFFNSFATPTLELVGPDEVDGVPVVRYRATIADDGPNDYRFTAEFDFWVEFDGDGARLLKLAFSGESVLESVSSGAVTATLTSVMNFEVYDVGDDTVEIIRP